MTSTRKSRRQSSSVATTRARGCRSVTNRASMSRRPRTALTGWPSGALNAVTGSPKKARNIRLDPSSKSQSAAIAKDRSPGPHANASNARFALKRGSRGPAGPDPPPQAGEGNLLHVACFELGAERQDGVLVARPADELDPDRQSAFGRGQRQADRRLTGAVERMGEAQPVEELVRRGGHLLADGAN